MEFLTNAIALSFVDKLSKEIDRYEGVSRAEFSHVDGVCFQQYLDWFSQAYPKQLHLVQLDNGRWHIWSELVVPDNVILIFQPPTCG